MARPLFSRYERFVRRPGLTSSNYDVTPDGSRFLMINDDDQDRQTSQQIIVVQGWANELNRLGNA